MSLAAVDMYRSYRHVTGDSERVQRLFVRLRRSLRDLPVSGVQERDRFADALAALDDVQGWLSDDQARRLWEVARALKGPATIVEIGSYHGRSTIVLAHAAAPDVEVVALDPHAGTDRGPREIHGTHDAGQRDYEQLHRNLARAGVDGEVRHIRLPAQAALSAVEGPVDLLYIDGAHRYRPARDDISEWGARVPPGGTLFVHDAFSAVGVTLAQIRLLFATPDFRYVGRTRSLAEYRRARLGPFERARNAARQSAQLAWFARNVAIKAALVARLRPLARLLGQRDGEWPY
jgi:predicted O-methyltransferase YrrM